MTDLPPVRPVPSNAVAISSVEAFNSAMNIKLPIAECDYIIKSVVSRDPLVVTESRFQHVSLDILVDLDIPQNLYMEAIECGLGNELIRTTINTGLGMISDVQSDAFTAMIPLFYNEVNRCLVSAEVHISKTGNPRYGRARVLLFMAVTEILNSSVPTSATAGGMYADIGLISESWTARALVDQISQWFADALEVIPKSQHASVYSSCMGRKHKVEHTITLSNRDLIEILVSGKCPRCNGIESSIAQDIPT